jgi:O-antigen/teichoic acid export membrane protein
MLFLFRSGGVAFQEVGIALNNDRQVGRTAALLGALASLALALVALTPLEIVWFERFSGLSHALAAFAVWPVRILLLYPALEYIVSFQRARWILEHRTRVVSIATAVEAVLLAATLFITVGALHMIGVIGGAIALLAGRVGASAYLFACGRAAARTSR